MRSSLVRDPWPCIFVIVAPRPAFLRSPDGFVEQFRICLAEICLDDSWLIGSVGNALTCRVEEAVFDKRREVFVFLYVAFAHPIVEPLGGVSRGRRTSENIMKSQCIQFKCVHIK